MNLAEEKWRRLLEEAFLQRQVPGVSIAVLYEDKITAISAGVVNVDTGVEVTPETVMHIGSIAKLFNATLLMQLVDEGKVDLDERVIEYLPGLKLRERDDLEKITVKMLLNHTSGIDGELLPDYGHDEETIEKAIVRFSELGQLHRPGAEFSYCNAGTVIAGYLAQCLSATSWYRLIRERIFQPLNMEHAVALPEEAILYRAGVGHYFDIGSNQKLVRTSNAFLPQSFGPAGTSLMMSARDLVAFASAHMKGGVGSTGARIISAQSAKAMQQVNINNKGKGYTYVDGVGIGWMVSEDGLLHHAGGGPGIVSVLYAHPERRFAAAVLTNAQHSLSLIHDFMMPWLSKVGITRPFDFADIQLPTTHVKTDFSKYVGVYENVLDRFRVSGTERGLTLTKQPKFSCYESISTSESPPAYLIPLGSDKFVLESDGKNDSGCFNEFIRVFAFRNPDAQGHMEHLGNSLRLYRRVS